MYVMYVMKDVMYKGRVTLGVASPCSITSFTPTPLPCCTHERAHNQWHPEPGTQHPLPDPFCACPAHAPVRGALVHDL